MVQEWFRGGRLFACVSHRPSSKRLAANQARPALPSHVAWRCTVCERDRGWEKERECVCHTHTRLCLTHGGVLARRLWHSHTHSLTLSRTLTLTLTHTLSHTHSLSLSRTSPVVVFFVTFKPGAR